MFIQKVKIFEKVVVCTICFIDEAFYAAKDGRMNPSPVFVIASSRYIPFTCDPCEYEVLILHLNSTDAIPSNTNHLNKDCHQTE